MTALSTQKDSSLLPTPEPAALEEENVKFLLTLKNIMGCGMCSSISAPRPWSVICEMGHVFCKSCVPELTSCPTWVTRFVVKKDFSEAKGQNESEKKEKSEKVEKKPRAVKRICGKELKENASIVYKQIFDSTKHYCLFPYCLETLRGDCLKIHMLTCTFCSFQKCQFGDKCGNPPNEKLAMNQYAKHLVIDHNVPLTFGPVTIVRVPVTEFAKYRKAKCFITNLIRTGQDIFGLTFIASKTSLCIMLTGIPVCRRFVKKYCFKLMLCGDGGIRRGVAGRIGTLSEATDSASRRGHFLKVGRTAIESGYFAVNGYIVFEVMIVDTETSPVAKWEDYSNWKM